VRLPPEAQAAVAAAAGVDMNTRSILHRKDADTSGQAHRSDMAAGSGGLLIRNKTQTQQIS
jgi:hypothetical protein